MILKNTGQQGKQEQGFTLIELLVAMAMLGIVMGAIYSTYKSQQDSYVAQEQVVEMQQNIRASFYQLARDLRMAGYNPQRSSQVGGFTDTKLVGDGIDETTTNSTNIAFYIDQNANGLVDAADNEQIAYRFSNNALQKFSVTTDTWQTVADNIDDAGLTFVYLDPNGNDITTNVENTPTSLSPVTSRPFIDSIGSVVVSITARTRTMDRELNDYRRRTLTTTILCRNLGT